MSVLGMHWLDFSIVILYIVLILWLGVRAHRRVKTADDFYLAGRRLGKVYQFFLNLGTSTNSDQAVVVSREIYRQGIGGMWIQYLVLFLTPFYWFSVFFFRRVRLVTIGDYFAERFGSRFLAGAFAVFTIVMSVIGGGVGYMVAGKTLMAMTPKPPARYTPAERLSVQRFRQFQELRQKYETSTLAAGEQKLYEELNERNKRGELRAFVSVIKPLAVYVIAALIVAFYSILGGFFAAAITDVIQGVLITIFSLLLIPIGLARIGGFSGLHATVPDFMFHLFGSAATSDYAWYTILAMVLANLVSIIASAPGMATAGSAKDEMTARVGMIGGMFFKRFIMIFWGLTGLLAIALYSGRLHDPDLIWGVMTRDLLFPGAIGLMLAGVLATKMSSLSAQSISYSALFLRNLYQPLLPGRPEKHYMRVAKWVVVVTLAGGVGVALYIDNLLDLFKYFISIPAVFGAAIWLGFVWRRLTRRAVIAQAAICFIIYAVVPNLFQGLNWARGHPAFLLETRPQTNVVRTVALREDVAAGRAAFVGQERTIEYRREGVGVFFEKVVRSDPARKDSPKEGRGRFNAEIWVLSWFGIDFSGWTKAQLDAARFFFDALFPFLLLFFFSLLTQPQPSHELDRFFAKLFTPVQPTPEAEESALESARRNPDTWKRKKLWPGSNWEIGRPSWTDMVGFGGSWLMVGLIIFLLWLMTSIR